MKETFLHQRINKWGNSQKQAKRLMWTCLKESLQQPHKKIPLSSSFERVFLTSEKMIILKPNRTFKTSIFSTKMSSTMKKSIGKALSQHCAIKRWVLKLPNGESELFWWFLPSIQLMITCFMNSSKRLLPCITKTKKLPCAFCNFKESTTNLSRNRWLKVAFT